MALLRIRAVLLPLGSILACALFVAVADGAAPRATEYEVKAAFIYNFAKYVQWPASRSDPRLPFVIGVIGKDPFGNVLDDVMSGQRVQRRAVVIRRLRS